MDREMREEYLVVIQAKDMGGHMGGLSGTTTVTVTLTDINDNPPKFSKSKELFYSLLWYQTEHLWPGMNASVTWHWALHTLEIHDPPQRGTFHI